MDITPYLKLMVEKAASDLFFTSDAPIKIKIEGTLQSVGKSSLTKELVEAAAFRIMDGRVRQEFESAMEVDFAIALDDGSARFRVNVFRQRGCVAMVLRLIPSKIPSI